MVNIGLISVKLGRVPILMVSECERGLIDNRQGLFHGKDVVQQTISTLVYLGFSCDKPLL